VTDWTRWPHAYGLATDTAEHLRALQGDDEQAQHAAAAHFGSAIVHQSTVWPASPDAFAALIEVLRVQRLPADVLTTCLQALAEAGEHVPPPGPVPDLSAEGQAWLARFATTSEDDHELLWEDLLGSPTDTEVYEWVMARMAALCPEVSTLVATLEQTNPDGLAEVRAMWLT
jgi:hypothetical protein